MRHLRQPTRSIALVSSASDDTHDSSLLQTDDDVEISKDIACVWILYNSAEKEERKKKQGWKIRESDYRRGWGLAKMVAIEGDVYLGLC